MNASMHSCIHIFIFSFLYSYLFISFIHFYHVLAILVLTIFLSCRLLLIHIFIYVPIIYVHVLIPMLCHLLLISIVLIIYTFLSCVPSVFHLIPFCMSIIYPYHLRIPIMSLYIHILSIFLSCFIYSFMYDNHMFTSYNLIFICAYHSCTLDYHILRHILSYLIISYDLYLSYLRTYPIISYHIFLFLYESTLFRNWN